MTPLFVRILKQEPPPPIIIILIFWGRKLWRPQLFEPHWYGEAFFWISHDRLLSRPWYEDHGFLSSTYVLITHSHSYIHKVWTILYGFYSVFWTPLKKFHSNSSIEVHIELDTHHSMDSLVAVTLRLLLSFV